MAIDLKLSRSGIEQHIRCPRCFYLQRKLKLKPPESIPLTLAVAVDALLKNEFDVVRATGESHPLWQRENLNVRAFQHENIDLWRSNFKGMRITHDSGAVVYGAVDDIWENLDTQELHIVDYKSTSKAEDPDLNSGFADGYKRQMEIYQWLFRQAGFTVSPVGYFLYANGSKKGGFYIEGTEGFMQFKTTLIPYTGNDDWVASAVNNAIQCYQSDVMPKSGIDCDSCRYYKERCGIDPKVS